MDQAASGLAVRSHDGMTPQRGAGRDPRARARAGRRAVAHLGAELCPALAEAGIPVGARRRATTTRSSARSSCRYQREIFPVLTPLGVGPGQPFPYISGLSLSLAVLARDPATGEERFARVKVPEGAAALRRRRRSPAGPARGRDRPLARHALSRDGDRRARRLPRHPRRRHRSLGRRRRPARGRPGRDPAPTLRRRRPRSRSRRRCRARCSTGCAAGSRVRDEEVYPIDGLLDLADAAEIAALDRPDLKDEPLAPDHAVAPPARADDGDIFAEIARGDIFVQHPYESFVTSYEAVHPLGVHGSARARAQDDRVPDERRVADRARRSINAAEAGKQSVCLVELKARFDERRNIEWGHAAGAGGRPRRLRLRRPEDPCQDDARRPAGGRPAPPVRPHRHRQLPLGHGPAVRGRRHLHGRRGRSLPTSPISSTSSRASAGLRSSASCSSPR